ncbi:MAG: YbaN family protein [Clostridiales Family XIII bacterium]|jgi:uncharacterized membrane protein YbaN (DUF454 family)|nr:YbaN family protein [Clostridiales Family XIII bacterium]
MKRILLLIAGFALLGVGAIGVFIPVLPTTPFVLASAGCFSVSSPRIYAWLEHSPFFGDYINGIKNRQPISTKARVQGIVSLWVLLTVSALIIQKPAMYIVFAIIGACVTIHLLTIRRPKRPN